jgi:hypothetical protein
MPSKESPDQTDRKLKSELRRDRTLMARNRIEARLFLMQAMTVAESTRKRVRSALEARVQ